MQPSNFSLQVLKEALKCNDQYSVYQRVAATYSLGDEQQEKAEKIYKIMARRFCKEPEVWTQLGQFYFKTGNLKDARCVDLLWANFFICLPLGGSCLVPS